MMALLEVLEPPLKGMWDPILSCLFSFAFWLMMSAVCSAMCFCHEIPFYLEVQSNGLSLDYDLQNYEPEKHFPLQINCIRYFVLVVKAD